MKNKVFENYNLYLNDTDQFEIESLEELERYVNLEMKDFAGKDKINLQPAKPEELENLIKTINDNNRNGISFLLISKEDDTQSEM